MSHQDLIEAGWPDGEMIGQVLAHAQFLEKEKGICDRKYLLKLLRRDFPPPPRKQGLREEPAPFSEAIATKTPEEEKNLGAVRRQMRELLRVPVIRRGVVMPDACPAGSAAATIPVGGAIAAENAIIPSAHSLDICCSMFASFYRCAQETGGQLDALAGATRFGPGGRPEGDRVHHPVLDEPVWDNPFLKGLEHKAEIHLADQGDGNHFAFLGEVELVEEQVEAISTSGLSLSPGHYRVLVTHHGSRGLGAAVFQRGQKAAVKQTQKVADGIPEAAAWLDAREPAGVDYWEALQYVSRWTRANHQCIHSRFLDALEVSAEASFGNEHNFVWRRGDIFYHGKGATPAWHDETGRPQLGLIPLNMAEPILVVLGRDNEAFLSFAPHGAGRNVSRKALLRRFRDRDGSLDEAAVRRVIEETTAGLDIRWFRGHADLTETPVAYKNAAQVKAQIAKFGLADVVAEITPLGCVMAGSSGARDGQEPLTPKQLRQIDHRASRRKNRQALRQEEEEY